LVTRPEERWIVPDDRQENESQHGVNEDLAARVRQRREEIIARRQAIEDGTARPEVYDAIDRACVIADEAPEDLRDQMRSSAVSLVSEEFARHEREGEPIDPAEIDAAVATQLRKYIYAVKSPSPLMSWLTGRNASIIGSVRSDLIAASRPLPPEPVTKGALPQWVDASAERSDRQIHALEGLLQLAENQNRLAPWMVMFAAVGAVAAVVAAVAAIVG
jgi:hypothetical protein